MNLPLVPTNEPKQVDGNPSSEMDFTREVGFLKRLKAAGPYGLSASLSTDGDELLTSELKLLGPF